MHNMCLMCNKKNDDTILRQINRIEELVRGNKDGDNRNTAILVNAFAQFGYSSHCPYGISCTHLRAMEMQANEKIRRIAPKIARFIEDANIGQIQTLLRLMQGYFPSAYRVSEKMWHEHLHTKGD